MSDRPRIFISAVSSEFEQLRQLIAQVLENLGYEPVRQDIFGTEPGDLKQMLRRKIDSCEGVVHVVGRAYGFEPKEIDHQFGRVSYTQYEFLYAQRQGKSTWLIFAEEGCTRDAPIGDLDVTDDKEVTDPVSYQEERRQLQSAWRQRLLQGEHIHHRAVSDDELKIKILQLRDEFAELRRDERSWRAWVVISLLAIFVLGTFTAALSSFTSVNLPSRIRTIDHKIADILESNLHKSISEQIGVDPQHLHQLLSQIEDSEKDALRYAAELAQQKRFSDSYAVAHCIAEVALADEERDYLVAAKAFMMATQTTRKLASQTGSSDKKLELLDRAVTLSTRGKDAFNMIDRDEQAANIEVFSDLLYEAADALMSSLTLDSASSFKPRIERALNTLNEGAKRIVDSPTQKKHQFLRYRLLNELSFGSDLAADVDPKRVRELISNCEALEKTAIEHASDLSEQQRFKDSYSLACLVAEDAVVDNRRNYRVAAEAYLIASQATKELAAQAKESSRQIELLDRSVAISIRGRDTFKLMHRDTQETEKELLSQLLYTGAEALKCSLNLVAQQELEPRLNQAMQLLSAKSLKYVDSAAERKHKKLKISLQEEISFRAGLENLGFESQNFRELLLESESSQYAAIQHAAVLAQRERFDDSCSLALFIAEDAMERSERNYLVSAKAFLIASQAKKKLASRAGPSDEQLELLDEAVDLSIRGNDAFKMMHRNEQETLGGFSADLRYDAADSLFRSLELTSSENVETRFEQAISFLDEGGKTIRESSSRAKHERLRFQLSLLFSYRSSFQKAQKLLVQAVESITSSLDSIPKKESSLRASLLGDRARAQYFLAGFQSQIPRRQPLRLARTDCEEALELLGDNPKGDLAATVKFFLGLALLRLGDSETDYLGADQIRGQGIQVLGEVIEAAKQNGSKKMECEASIALLYGLVSVGDFDEASDPLKYLADDGMDLATPESSLIFGKAIMRWGGYDARSIGVEKVQATAAKLQHDLRARFSWIVTTPKLIASAARSQQNLRERFAWSSYPLIHANASLNFVRLERIIERNGFGIANADSQASDVLQAMAPLVQPCGVLHIKARFRELEAIQHRNEESGLRIAEDAFSMVDKSVDPDLWLSCLFTLASHHSNSFRDVVTEAINKLNKNEDRYLWEQCQLALGRHSYFKDGHESDCIGAFKARMSAITLDHAPVEYLESCLRVSESFERISSGETNVQARRDAIVMALRWAILAYLQSETIRVGQGNPRVDVYLKRYDGYLGQYKGTTRYRRRVDHLIEVCQNMPREVIDQASLQKELSRHRESVVRLESELLGQYEAR